jgi:hypothetical protein
MQNCSEAQYTNTRQPVWTIDVILTHGHDTGLDIIPELWILMALAVFSGLGSVLHIPTTVDLSEWHPHFGPEGGQGV